MYSRIANYSSTVEASKGEIIERAGQVCSTQNLIADMKHPTYNVFERHYIPAIKTILNVRHPWSFASKTAKLVPVAGDNNKGLYYVPSDNVRIHAIGSESCCGNIEEHEWRFQEGYIKICCGCSVVYYNYYNPNITSWSLTNEDAVTALVYCLAKMCIAFIHKDIHLNTALQVSAMYERMLSTAILSDKSNTNTFTVRRKKNGIPSRGRW